MSTPDYTAVIAASLNARREITLGTDAALELLDHAASGGAGYDAILTVATDWTMRGPETRGEPWLLEICENDDSTAELLQVAAAFRINGRVWVPIDNQFTSPAPIANNRRVWRWELRVESTPAV